MAEDPIIRLNVGGTIFSTHKSTLTAQSGYFQAMFSGNWSESSSNPKEPPFIDRDPENFRQILNWLRDPRFELPTKVLPDLEYFQIDHGYQTEPEPIEPFSPSTEMEAEAQKEVEERYESFNLSALTASFCDLTLNPEQAVSHNVSITKFQNVISPISDSHHDTKFKITRQSDLVQNFKIEVCYQNKNLNNIPDLSLRYRLFERIELVVGGNIFEIFYPEQLFFQDHLNPKNDYFRKIDLQSRTFTYDLPFPTMYLQLTHYTETNLNVYWKPELPVEVNQTNLIVISGYLSPKIHQFCAYHGIAVPPTLAEFQSIRANPKEFASNRDHHSHWFEHSNFATFSIQQLDQNNSLIPAISYLRGGLTRMLKFMVYPADDLTNPIPIRYIKLYLHSSPVIDLSEKMILIQMAERRQYPTSKVYSISLEDQLINFNRVDQIQFTFGFYSSTISKFPNDQEFKIIISNQSENFIRYSDGMVGLVYAHC